MSAGQGLGSCDLCWAALASEPEEPVACLCGRRAHPNCARRMMLSRGLVGVFTCSTCQNLPRQTPSYQPLGRQMPPLQPRHRPAPIFLAEIRMERLELGRGNQQQQVAPPQRINVSCDCVMRCVILGMGIFVVICLILLFVGAVGGAKK